LSAKSFEKSPYHFTGIHILTGFADDCLIQILKSLGPGMATIQNHITYNFASIGSPGVYPLFDGGAIIGYVR